MFRVLLLALLVTGSAVAQSVQLSDSEAQAIGKRIWKNECAGTVSGLTSWNRGEDFASLGIGHFIWYVEGKPGVFEESFPSLVAYLDAHGEKNPAWLHGHCPWKTRAAFEADLQSPRMTQLRGLLADTVALQARFCARRLEEALPKMLGAAPKADRDRIRANFYRVAAQPLGMYALIDYVNFKGEGVDPSERYHGQGWGLLQVLQSMGNGPALGEYAKAANHILTQRVENSPPARHESQWLPGWRNRVASYAG